MGWSTIIGSTKEELLRYLTGKETRFGHTAKGASTPHRCLAQSLRGNDLWTVWETESEGRTLRFINLNIIGYDKGAGGYTPGWGHRDYGESSHPYHYGCPLKFLAMVTPEMSQPGWICEEWREKVRAFHAAASERRKQSKTIKGQMTVGATLELAPRWKIRSVTITAILDDWTYGMGPDGINYRLKPRHLVGAKILPAA